MLPFKDFLGKFSNFAIGLTILLNLYIYTYPSLDPQSCSWSYQYETPSFSTLPPWIQKARKLPYLGDLLTQYVFKPEYKEPEVPDLKMLAFGDPQIKGNWPSTPYIQRLDTFGNDYYLGHIYRVMQQRLQPTHVAVLGDLFSSQWILDSEFFNRTRRYVTRLYDQPDVHRQHVLDVYAKHENIDWKAFMEKRRAMDKKDFEYGYQDVYDWTTPDYKKSDDEEVAKAPLFLNVSGNHDIGYSGDATWQHMARYFDLFGKDNFWIEYDVGTPHAYRIVVLNSLLLEGPALQPEFLEYTWEFLYQLFERKFEGATILLTHVPFYKEEGLCVDGPHFDYYKEDAREQYKIGKLRSQNHLSEEVSQRVLSLVFGNTKYPGIILTGHDHEGCQTVYNFNSTNRWYAAKQKQEDFAVKEITVRAMMGEYGGNTGILTGHFNQVSQQWEYKFKLCPFIVQHVWWATKVTTIVAVLARSLVVLSDFF